MHGKMQKRPGPTAPSRLCSFPKRNITARSYSCTIFIPAHKPKFINQLFCGLFEHMTKLYPSLVTQKVNHFMEIPWTTIEQTVNRKNNLVFVLRCQSSVFDYNLNNRPSALTQIQEEFNFMQINLSELCLQWRLTTLYIVALYSFIH